MNQTKVFMLLLSFCDLSKAEQNVYVDGLNRYLFVSPSKRRQLIERWKAICCTELDKKALRRPEETPQPINGD